MKEIGALWISLAYIIWLSLMKSIFLPSYRADLSVYYTTHFYSSYYSVIRLEKGLELVYL